MWSLLKVCNPQQQVQRFQVHPSPTRGCIRNPAGHLGLYPVHQLPGTWSFVWKDSIKDSGNSSSTRAPYRKCHTHAHVTNSTNSTQRASYQSRWTPLSVSLSVSTGARIAGPKFQLNVIILVIIKHMSAYVQVKGNLS